jgi:cytochrome c nitrite reductase small subunit
LQKKYDPFLFNFLSAIPEPTAHRRIDVRKTMRSAIHRETEAGFAPYWLLLVAGIIVGILLGVGAYTFRYAEGLSYLSSDPRACVNCHIMRAQYDSWQKASHHGVAACVDCHLPHDFIGKYLAKANNGWHHSKGFTLQNFHEPIMITPKNAKILQANCLNCHQDMVHNLVAGATRAADAVSCVHCHQSVGHGEPLGLGGPDRGAKEGNTHE